ncbi:Chemotaxis protein MotB [Pseudomonas syringae pv. primulae]|uniref:Chemotaxis protein MotB n=1 Tax=Pseudomonas syringae pv. primulae TaxID=251707 RepID=A0A0N8SMA0_9PSED|nr:Chemotaxis protein MotB [Pseudomonas syringae pv. primulae]
MKFESGEAADFLGHGSASSASAKTHASKLRVPCTTLRSPWLLCRRGFAKTFDEWIVNDSSQCERATEAGFGELLYHDEGLVKAGAHYTGIAHESESFFCETLPARHEESGVSNPELPARHRTAPRLRGRQLKRFTDFCK